MSSFVDDLDSESDIEGSQEVSEWLDEDDPEPEPKPAKVLAKVESVSKIDVVHKSRYIVENCNLFYALCEVDDLGFEKLPDDEQEKLMKALKVNRYNPGEIVILEGDTGGDMYVVVASDETADTAEVEVVNGNILAGTEVFLTRLHRGQYFGQKFFLTRRANKRGATVRVPKDAPGPVDVAVLTPEFFLDWDSFRSILLVRTVPLIQMLPRKERNKILQNLVIREFKDGEYIIRQGEKGEDFFIVQEGSVKVVEKRASSDKNEEPQEVTLVTLREGHFFGEMSLVTDEPRVASVISIKNTICMCLSKQVFRSALSDETFNEVFQEVLKKRKMIRDNREKENDDSTSASSPSQDKSKGLHSPNVSMRRMVQSKRRISVSLGSNEVREVNTLSMKKLDTGYRVINKYIVQRELGKGSFGDVYLCKDQETGEEFAMKMINRPQSTWNDDASSIKQEIAVMKRLQHQNIVGLREVIDDNNARKIFLIQEFMEGGPLMPDAETVEPLDVATARRYFRDILRGVCYLHSEGIVHRDIKPQNMLLSADGIVKIADFGAAVFTDGQEKVAYGGTPAFMAPELYLINNSDIDFSKMTCIDIFALGASLYFMIVGRPPWMAKNQIDLATKIKNIELTFPVEHIDPHLKHLLRQMLAKDYRTRVDLDAIIIDDWVTFEGSEPLFEEVDYYGSCYPDFHAVTLIQDENPDTPLLKILLIHPSFVIRTMLSQQINNLTHAICACAANAEDALALMKSAMQSHPMDNFAYVFVEMGAEWEMSATNMVKEIRALGFAGKIVGMTSALNTLDVLLQSGVLDVAIKRPIANKDLTLILSKTDLERFAEQNNMAMGSAIEKITKEEMDQAITTTGHNEMMKSKSMKFGPRIESRNSLGSESPNTTGKAALIENDEDQDEQMQDFQNNSNKAGRRDSFDETEAFTQLSEKKTRTKSLSRKRGFLVVPYDQQDQDQSNQEQDRQIKILSSAQKEDKRKERREAAMRRSQLARQYREAKKNGDDKGLSESISALNVLRGPQGAKSKRSFHMKSAHGRSFGGNMGGKAASMHSMASHASMRSNSSSPSAHEDNRPQSNGRPALDRTSTEDLESWLEEGPDAMPRVEETGGESDTDSDKNYSGHGDDSSEDEDGDENLDDDDLVCLDEDITQLDDDAMNDLFDSLTTKKDEDVSKDLKEWNHIVVGKEIHNHFYTKPGSWSMSLGVNAGKAENIVGRTYMEDRSYVNAVEPGAGIGGCPLAFFGVYDGHNGDYVAEMLKDRYAATFNSLLRSNETSPEFQKLQPNSSYEARIGEIFEETNLLIDKEILEKDTVRQQKCLKSGIQDQQSFAGSVSVAMAVMPALRPKGALKGKGTKAQIQCFISHVGDCRAVLSNDGTAVQLTEDHKANLKSEKTRIEAAGGWVHNGRVNGSLGVARSFGDIQFKSVECNNDGSPVVLDRDYLWGTHQCVVSKPEFHNFIVEKHHEFVIMASDGLWDVFPSQEAVNFVRKKMFNGKDLDKIANELIQKAQHRGTQDNTSVVIVGFHQYTENKQEKEKVHFKEKDGVLME